MPQSLLSLKLHYGLLSVPATGVPNTLRHVHLGHRFDLHTWPAAAVENWLNDHACDARQGNVDAYDSSVRERANEYG